MLKGQRFLLQRPSGAVPAQLATLAGGDVKWLGKGGLLSRYKQPNRDQDYDQMIFDRNLISMAVVRSIFWLATHGIQKDCCNLLAAIAMRPAMG